MNTLLYPCIKEEKKKIIVTYFIDTIV